MGFRMPSDMTKGLSQSTIKVINREVDSYINRQITAAKKAYQALREKSVTNWFVRTGHYNQDYADIVNKSTVYGSNVNWAKGDNIEITLTSDVDGAKLDSLGMFITSSLNAWREKHTEVTMPYTMSEFRWHLLWYEGILALPLSSHIGSGWVNSHPMISGVTAQRYVEDYINSNIASAAVNGMQSRSQTKGSGILSKNRNSGMKNLKK